MGEREQKENPAMRAEEVRRMLGGIGKNTLYEWVNQGLIPHKRVRRVILFSRKRILAWLENRDNEGGNQ
ncbi:hypothetical protein ES708_01791 [subsurface metagenome]